MTTFLLNLLLLLGIVWMLLGISYFGYQVWRSQGQKQEPSDTSGKASGEDAQEVTLHDLVGKSRPFVSPPIPGSFRRFLATNAGRRQIYICRSVRDG